MPTVITPTLERTCERSCNSDTSNTLDIPIPRGYTKYNSPYHQVPLIENNKDKEYPSWLAHKIFTIEFNQTMHDTDVQETLIHRMLAEFPSIRRFVCFYDRSDKMKNYSKHHYHGYLLSSNFKALHMRYGFRKGRKMDNMDLLIWMRTARKGDTSSCHNTWHEYIESYVSGRAKFHKNQNQTLF